MTVSATGASPSFSQFAASTIAYNASQQLKGAAASVNSSLLTDTFGNPAGDGAPGTAGGSESDESTQASMAGLLAAYMATKSLSPVALAYLQNMPANSTTSTQL
jgi:hypothetical protein